MSGWCGMLLKPGGHVVPARGVIRVALAEDLRDDRERLGDIDGFDLSAFNSFMPPVRSIRVARTSEAARQCGGPLCLRLRRQRVLRAGARVCCLRGDLRARD